MQKKLVLFFGMIWLSIAGFSQSVPIAWSVAIHRQNNDSYLIEVKALVANGWYVYATGDSAEQLSDIDLGWENDSVSKISALQYENRAILLPDKIFKKKLRVYTRDMELYQLVRVRGPIPAFFKITIHAFASNGTEFEPILVEKKVFLKGGEEGHSNSSGQIRLLTVDLNKPIRFCDNEKKRLEASCPCFLWVWPENDRKYKQWAEFSLKADKD